MNPKVKLILYLLSFVITICITADIVFSRYFTKTNPVSESNKIYRLAEQTFVDEIPIFGTSRAEKGYFCDAINEQCYNYGFPNQSFDITALLLQFELAKNKTTPILIDVHHDFFQHDAKVNINLNTYLPFVNSNAAVTTFLQENNRLKPYHYLPGTRYFGAYTTYMEPIFENKFGIGRALYSKGSVLDTKKGSTAAIQKRINTRLDKKLSFEVIAEKDSMLRSLIQLHPNRKFVFIVSPYHWSAKSTVANFDSMLQYFSELEASFPNVAFIYFNTDNYSDTYFKDTVHLNEDGAKVFSAELHNQLKDKGIL